MSYNIDWNAIDAYNDPTGGINGPLDDRGEGGAPPGFDLGLGDVPEPVAADVVSGLGEPTTKRTLPNPGDAQDAVVGSYPTPSPDDLLRNSLPGPQVANPTTPDDYLRNALNANPGPAQHPQTAEQMAFQSANPNGGSFTNPNPNSNMSLEQQAFQSKYPGGGSFNNQGQPIGGSPSLPNPGGSGNASTTSSGGPLSDEQWKQDFISKFGFFDPAYNSKENFLHNAQMGDQVIRKDSKGIDELAAMAKVDSDAAKVYAGLEGPGKGIYGSQLGADWASGHNTDIVAEMKAAVAGKNMAALENLKAQLANVPANPQTNREAFPVAAQIAADLNTLGATDIRMIGTTIAFTPASGGATAYIFGADHNIKLPDWIDAAAYLHNAVAEKQNAAAAAAQPQPQAPGGYGRNAAPRGYTPPRGGGGSQQAPPEIPAVGAGNPPYDNLAAQRLNDFFPTPESRVGVPRSAASAVGYMPAIQPGGFSPYDEP